MKRIFRKKLLDIAGVDEVEEVNVWQEGKRVYCSAYLDGRGLDSSSLREWNYGKIDYWRVDHFSEGTIQIKFHLTEHPMYDEVRKNE